MNITVTVTITEGGEATVTTQSGPTEAAGASAGEPQGAAAHPSPDVAPPGADTTPPPPHLLARAQALGASNAGAAPAQPPEAEGPPVFTGSAPPVAMDEASYEEGLAEGVADVSAGPAPGTGVEEELAVVTDAYPQSEEAGNEDGESGSGEGGGGKASDAGPPRRRTTKRTAKKK